MDKKYSLWVGYNQISKVEDEVKNCKEKSVKEYKPSDFTNIDDKKSFEILLSIKNDMSCDKLKCNTLDAIIEMYKTYHSRRNNG